MRLTALSLLTVFTLIFMSAGQIRADEIWLKNGDRLTGKVERMENNVLIFSTAYAGEISIIWQEVQKLKTVEAVRVVLRDNTATQGPLLPREAGEVAVRSGSIPEPLAFQLDQIKMINPKVEPLLKAKGRLNLGANYARGNTDTDDIYGDAELVARTEANRYSIGGLYRRSKEGDVKTAENMFGYMKYDHFFTKKLYGYANATAEKNEFKDLNLRSALGLGLGYQFIETKQTNLSLEAGLSYVNEDFIVAVDQDYGAGRWAFNFDHLLWADRLQFFHHHQGLISIKDSDDISVLSQTGFRIPFYKSLNATLQFNYDWEKSPPPGTEKADKTYIFTIGYQWAND